MNQHSYLHVLESRVRPQMEQWSAAGVNTFMHDSAPCHKARQCTNYLQQINLPVLKWPSNSPDLNPLETLWGILKQRLSEFDLPTKQTLISKIIHLWHNDVSILQTCEKLIDSMPKRIQAVIKARGGHTRV